MFIFKLQPSTQVLVSFIDLRNSENRVCGLIQASGKPKKTGRKCQKSTIQLSFLLR
ncbi:hypothetical protein NNRS527_01850 [Nitrosospira sp. NRS527]|nr:hypothetical protein NNRS527_01850 [Nitrosospira sp. NRS527]